MKSKEYVSIFGSIMISRAYYWNCGSTGIFPLDAKLNLPEKKFSYLLTKWTHRRIAEGPYQEALDSINDIFKIQLWSESQEASVKKASINVDEFYNQKRILGESEGNIIVATTDCKGVPMVPSERPEKAKNEEDTVKGRRGRGEKGLKRDAVVTSDFTIIPEKRTAEEAMRGILRQFTDKEKGLRKLERLERKKQNIHEPRVPMNKQVKACMGGKKKAFQQLADRISNRDPDGKKKILILIDGSPSLEEKLLEEFEIRGWSERVDGVVLDIFHVTEYLWDTATALHGVKNASRQKWVEKELLALLEGRVGRVIGAMKQMLTRGTKNLKNKAKASLERTVKYFENHEHMMRYDEYLRKGYPIGTGVIEGACGSLVKDRTELSGMKWTKEGAQAVLNLRATKQNGDWEDYMKFHMTQEQQRLYGKTVLAKAA